MKRQGKYLEREFEGIWKHNRDLKETHYKVEQQKLPQNQYCSHNLNKAKTKIILLQPSEK